MILKYIFFIADRKKKKREDVKFVDNKLWSALKCYVIQILMFYCLNIIFFFYKKVLRVDIRIIGL